MAKNRQHQWEPVPDSDMVKCSKCGIEVKATQARKGVGPCLWGEKKEDPEEKARIMRETHLCDTCTKQPAECESNPKFGTGIGNDNVYECDGYFEGEKLPGRPIGVTHIPPKSSGPRLTDPPEICNACGNQLAILPLNSRLDMIACNNSRCALYRERIRMVTKSVERGKRNRAKG